MLIGTGIAHIFVAGLAMISSEGHQCLTMKLGRHFGVFTYLIGGVGGLYSKYMFSE
jgi:hypothetical protein